MASYSTYWLVAGVSANDGGNSSWGYTLSSNQTGVSGWTIGDGYSSSNNQGTSWQIVSGVPFQFSVNATESVPEPSSLVGLLGLGALGLVSPLKKKK